MMERHERNRIRHVRRGERGQDLIEYALILPILLLLLFGIMDFAIVIFSYNTIANAAREGARAGIIHNTSTTEIENAASKLTTGLDTVQITTAGAPCVTVGESITVTVNYTPPLFTGKLILGGASVPLQAVASMQCE